MTGKDLNVDDGGVVGVQRDINDKYDDLKAIVRHLQAVIDSFEGRWQGIGRAAFDKKQIEINESMAALGKILADVMEGMTSALKTKNMTEDDIEAKIAKIEATSSAFSKM